MKPKPEIFAKTVLTELARLRGEVFATRLRLYQLMKWLDYPQSVEDVELEDKRHIEEFVREALRKSLTECGLTPDPMPPDKNQ
jgi:hypothetical protein